MKLVGCLKALNGKRDSDPNTDFKFINYIHFVVQQLDAKNNVKNQYVNIKPQRHKLAFCLTIGVEMEITLGPCTHGRDTVPQEA